jgi:hypothetical protein
MVVIGCDCDARMCEFISQTPPQWASVGECEAAMKHQTLSQSLQNYPVVTGICKEQNPDGSAVVTASAKSVDPVQTSALPATAEPQVQPAAYSGVVEGGRMILYRTANGYTVARDTLGRAASGTAAIARSAGGRLIERLARTF